MIEISTSPPSISCPIGHIIVTILVTAMSQTSLDVYYTYSVTALGSYQLFTIRNYHPALPMTNSHHLFNKGVILTG